MSLALTTVPLQASGELLHLLWYAEAGHRRSSCSHTWLAGFSVISFYLAVVGVHICSGKSYLFPECVVTMDINHLYQLSASPEGSLSSISIFWDMSSNRLPAAYHDLSLDHTTPAVSPSPQILGVLLCLGQALGFKLCRCSLSLEGIARSQQTFTVLYPGQDHVSCSLCLSIPTSPVSTAKLREVERQGLDSRVQS